MDSKQTDGSNKGKQAIPKDWLPDLVEEKTKPSNPANEELAAVMGEMLSQGIGGSGTRKSSQPSGDNKNTIDTTQPADKNTAAIITDTTDSVQTEPTNRIEPIGLTGQTDTAHSTVSKRSSNKQRKASLEEYRLAFLSVPKLEDRKPVFISREVRDKIDEIARKLGGRGMSVSGFIENLTRHHLEMYREDIELWKRL